jgi:hypothetical protein
LCFEGFVEGVVEGFVECVVEGFVEGVFEGVVEGFIEGFVEGVVEGVVECARHVRVCVWRCTQCVCAWVHGGYVVHERLDNELYRH